MKDKILETGFLLDRSNTCCFSGYRPHKFGFCLSNGCKEYEKLTASVINSITELIKNGYNNFICGGAMGFDLLCAEQVIYLKKNYSINLYCIIPFNGQKNSFTSEWKLRYDNVISKSDKNIVLYDEYERFCYSKRNRLMVDLSSAIITYFDGKSGGTAQTVKYAEQSGLKIINLHSLKSEQMTLF